MVNLVRVQRVLFTMLAVLALSLAFMSAAAHGATISANDDMMMVGMSAPSGTTMTCDDINSCGEDSSLCYFVCVTSGAVMSAPLGWDHFFTPATSWRGPSPAAPPGQSPSPGDRPPKLRLV